jgi:hypothetical protein
MVIEDENPNPNMNSQINGIARLLTILDRALTNFTISLSQMV